MIKLHILLKALRFVCIPTVALIFITLFAVFDIGKTVDFLTSSNTGSIMTRIALIVVEIILVYHMYIHYQEEEDKKLEEDKLRANLSDEEGKPLLYDRIALDGFRLLHVDEIRNFFNVDESYDARHEFNKKRQVYFRKTSFENKYLIEIENK